MTGSWKTGRRAVFSLKLSLLFQMFWNGLIFRIEFFWGGLMEDPPDVMRPALPVIMETVQSILIF
jgi:hypothetical protein